MGVEEDARRWPLRHPSRHVDRRMGEGEEARRMGMEPRSTPHQRQESGES